MVKAGRDHRRSFSPTSLVVMQGHLEHRSTDFVLVAGLGFL